MNNASHASARFGLGPSLQDIKDCGSDPRGWLEMQLKHASIPQELAFLKSNNSKTQQDFGELYQNKRSKMRREEASSSGKSKELRKDIRQAYIEQNTDRFLAQVASKQPFVERLLLFWSNHFTVSVKKPLIAGLVNPYEVQAIRPFIMGRFADLLRAAIQHPAMLIYLDNARSIGPNSQRGQRLGKSLNENLGREILELHTLGVGGGYTQQDVIALATIITGWSLDTNAEETIPQFAFQPSMHEPGPKLLLGKTYHESGADEGIAALNDLARHPSTARHIATKLARHFIGDNPPAASIDALTQIYLQTDGNLSSLYSALIQREDAWRNPLTKFKNSYEFVISAMRLRNIALKPKQVTRIFRALNIMPFTAPSPAGFPDESNYWASSDSILKRIDWAQAIAEDVDTRTDALAIAQEMFGTMLHEETSFIIKGAPSPKDAFAFLLVSPEFQRR